MDRFTAKYHSALAAGGGAAADDALYQDGIQVIKTHQHDPAACEVVLHQLMFLFPDRPELLYFQACMALARGGPGAIPTALYWFHRAFLEFYRGPPESWSPYHLENLLDYFKLLFDHHYTKYLECLMKTHEGLFRHLSSLATVDVRWLLFLGAFYIKTHQLQQADRIYSYLLHAAAGSGEGGGAPPVPSKDLQYKIYNNSLILYTRMACFDRIPDLLRRNFDVCHALLDDPSIEFATKKNLFCSNMLQYDYMYHDPADRRAMCAHVETYFPVKPRAPVQAGSAAAAEVPGSVDLLGLEDLARDGGDRGDGRIRVGYVSADFVEHAVSHFILPILQYHDTARFDVTLFTTHNHATVVGDPRYAPNCQRHRVVDLQHLTTDECVDRIQTLGLDILLDLNGFTEGHRLDVFARNPAPVQVAYLGFPNTVGSAHLCRYRLTDSIADLPASLQWFAEERVYLNRRGFLLYRPVAQEQPVAFRDGNSPFFPWVVFGAINRESKNSDAVLACWRAILLRASHTKILIKLSTVEDDAIHRAKYLSALEGIAPDRVLFMTYGSTDDYFHMFSVLDVVLDTFPYSGTTTTCNALYNSVPVVTMIHRDLHAHNVSASIVIRSGMTELVAETPEEYVDKAVALAMDTERRVGYRGDAQKPGSAHLGFVAAMEPEPFMEDYEAALTRLRDQNATAGSG